MYELGDIVQMKKPHACTHNRFEIIRLGMDIKIRCLGCSHAVMLQRKEFDKKMKKILVKKQQVDLADEPHYLMINQGPNQTNF